jgi:HK97 family phage portal protein
MAWWSRWIGRAVAATDSDFWTGYFGSETWSGETVNEHGAMQLSAFWACTRLISQTLATLPLGLFERDANGNKRAITQHDLYGLLHDSPNADQTAVEFWEGRGLGLCTAGNGYAEKMQRANGSLIALERMPCDTAVRRLDNGALEYSFYDRGKLEKLPESKVFHIRGFGDGDVGMSPVSYARQTLGIATATEKATGQTFGKGMRAKGFLTTPKRLDAEQRAQAQKNLVDPFLGPNGKTWGILEGGFDFKTVNITPHDAELILSRKFNVEDICRWLGVPPIMVGHSAEGQTMWGTGVASIMSAWLMTGLRPYLVRVEQAAKKRLLTPGERARGIFIEFNVEGLLRGDANVRGEFYNKLVQVGALTPNEARALENRSPLEGGDDLLINSTLIPLRLAGLRRPNTGAGQ